MAGCRPPRPCWDCNSAEDGEDDNEDLPQVDLPDLPCGGANLMTDNLNCGTCGHECIVDYAGTDYEAGTCSAGACGPSWSSCWTESEFWPTCAGLCAAAGEGCVANGCSGYTGILYEILFGDGCDPYDEPPVATMTGSCDEPIPWMSSGDYPRAVMCCCDFQ